MSTPVSDPAFYVPRLISHERLMSVCLAGQGHRCCRYVMGGVNGILCAKKAPELKAMLDEKAFRGQIRARGDNCSGLPLS